MNLTSRENYVLLLSFNSQLTYVTKFYGTRSSVSNYGKYAFCTVFYFNLISIHCSLCTFTHIYFSCYSKILISCKYLSNTSTLSFILFHQLRNDGLQLAQRIYYAFQFTYNCVLMVSVDLQLRIYYAFQLTHSSVLKLSNSLETV